MRLLKTVVLAGAAIMALNLSVANAAGLWVSYTGHDSFQYYWGAQLRTTSALNFDSWLSADCDNAPNGEHIGATYCIDLQGRVPHNPSEYCVEARSDGANWPDAFNRTNFGKVAYLINTYAPGALTRDQRNGLQVAIWECAYEGKFSYQGGLDAPADAAYQAYKTGAAGHTSDNLAWYDASAATGGGQDMGRPVPEPASMLLLGAGLIGLGFAGFRKRA